MDYGRRLEFGYFLVPDAGDPGGVLDRDSLRIFIEDVAPQVRDRVATARADPRSSVA